jgi:hypothetical protein
MNVSLYTYSSMASSETKDQCTPLRDESKIRRTTTSRAPNRYEEVRIRQLTGSRQAIAARDHTACDRGDTNNPETPKMLRLVRKSTNIACT